MRNVERELFGHDHGPRVKWLIGSRFLFSLLLLGVLFFFQLRYSLYSFPAYILIILGVSVTALSAFAWGLSRERANPILLTYSQLVGDILFVSSVLYLTGGIDSGYAILYHLAIITASIFASKRGIYFAASLSSIFYGVVLDMQYYNMFGMKRSQNFTDAQVLSQLTITILSFYVVAFLSGYLADRLRRTRLELQEKSTDFEDLRTIQEHILRNVGSGIVTMDMGGRISSWNPAAETITGYRYEEIVDRWQEVFGASVKGIFGHTDELRARPFSFSGQIRGKDGRRLSLNMTASLLKDERDSVNGIIILFQDITRLVEMEEQVRRQDRLATIGSLAAGIAHEIRNPLASLSGSIQVLKGELDLQGDNRRLMDIVIREADRLNTIITEFLEYARPRTTVKEPLPLAPLIDDTVALLTNSRELRPSIAIEQAVDRSLSVFGDAQRLRQVFWNLLINACQAMPGGGVVRIAARPLAEAGSDDDLVEILLSDTGSGIAPEHVDRIFDPFFTTKAEGTGLGLAIVHRIVSDHDGTIAVESEATRGTTMRIVLHAADSSVPIRS